MCWQANSSWFGLKWWTDQIVAVFGDGIGFLQDRLLLLPVPYGIITSVSCVIIHPPGVDAAAPSPVNQLHRDLPAGAMSTIVETATPTPNLKGLVMENSNASSADKKRNKLGYHRTSVACVHCRRRKIRCLVAADDSQGRCENCIRLRKECHFFPVDQQPPVEKRSRPGSKLETSTDPSASSSPPPLGGGGGLDPAESYYPYSPLPQEMSTFGAGAFAGTPMSTFAADPTVEYATTPTMESWDDHTLFDQQNPQMMPKSRMGNPSPVLWSQGGAPGAPVAPIPSSSPVPGVSGQPQMINTGPTYGVPPDPSLYHMSPTRSISLELASQYPNQYPPHVSPDFKRRVTSPSQNMDQIASPIHGSSPSMQELQAAHIPVSFAGQPAAMGYQTWNTVHGLPGAPSVDGSYSMFPSELQTDFNGQHMAPDASRSPGL